MVLKAFQIVVFSMVCSSCFAKTLTDERKSRLLDKFIEYQVDNKAGLFKSSDAVSQTSQVQAGEHCEDNPYSQLKACLEDKYMSNGFYVVKINYVKEPQFPVEPSIFILKDDVLIWDTSERDAFLLKWKSAAALEYVGENYDSYQSIRLLWIQSDRIGLEILIDEATQLTELLLDPRIISVTHIANPTKEPELVMPTN